MYHWDYISQMNAFLDSKLEILSQSEVILYLRLFQINNTKHREEWFQANNLMLSSLIGMTEKSMIQIRNSLRQKGMIEFKAGKKGSPTKYKLTLLYNQKNTVACYSENYSESYSESMSGTRENTGVSDSLKGKREKVKVKDINKKENIKEKAVKFADVVSMTNDEHKSLIDKIGEDGVAWCVEKLNNYKLSTGKKYKSDYRAILSWVIGEWEKNAQRASGCAGKGKAKARISEDPDKFKGVTGWGDIFPDG